MKSYLGYFRAFLHFFRGRDPVTITREDIEQYLLTLIRRRNISESTQNGVIDAIKCYYEQVLGHESIKKTGRYLHVSTEALRRMRSPPDNLDRKG